MIGYKLLTAEGRSLSMMYGGVYYDLSGAWQEIPGCGAYLGLTIPGLLRGGFGPLLVECEYAEPTGALDDGEVITARRVRIQRSVLIDEWAFVRVACRTVRVDLSNQVLPATMEAYLLAIDIVERCVRRRSAEGLTAAVEALSNAALLTRLASPIPRTRLARTLARATAAARVALATIRTPPPSVTWRAAMWAAAEPTTALPAATILNFLIEEAWDDQRPERDFGASKGDTGAEGN